MEWAQRNIVFLGIIALSVVTLGLFWYFFGRHWLTADNAEKDKKKKKKGKKQKQVASTPAPAQIPAPQPQVDYAVLAALVAAEIQKQQPAPTQAAPEAPKKKGKAA